MIRQKGSGSTQKSRLGKTREPPRRGFLGAAQGWWQYLRDGAVEGGHSGGSDEAVDGGERVVDGGDDEGVADPDEASGGEGCITVEQQGSAGARRVLGLAR